MGQEARAEQEGPRKLELMVTVLRPFPLPEEEGLLLERAVMERPLQAQQVRLVLAVHRRVQMVLVLILEEAEVEVEVEAQVGNLAAVAAEPPLAMGEMVGQENLLSPISCEESISSTRP